MTRLMALRILLAVIALSVAACERPGGERWQGTIETLPNGATRVTNPEEGFWTNGSRWHLRQELVLGSIEGGDATEFTAISGLQVDADGRIYVLDRQSNELRMFDATGRHLRTVGRAGSGPGEYDAANGIAWIDDDTLLVVDQRGGRYTVLSRDGEHVRSVQRRLGFYGWVFRGGIDGNRVYEVAWTESRDDRRPILVGTPIRFSGPTRDTVVTGNSEQSTLVSGQDTVPLPRPDVPRYDAFRVRADRGATVVGVPFTGSPVYVLDGTGGIWHGHGSIPRVYHSSLIGDTIMEILIPWEPHAVSAAEVAEWAAGEVTERFRNMGGKLDLDRIPKEKPFFDGLALDPSGNIWLPVPAASREVVFGVFDPDGRYLGRLSIENVERVSNLNPVLRNDRLYFVGRDELDVQRVYVYRISE